MRRKLIQRQLNAAVNIQRVYRGHIGRVTAYVKRLNLNATLIQKMFRGFLSRKKIHDFFVRKKFIQRAVLEGTYLKKLLQKSYRDQVLSQQTHNQQMVQSAVQSYWLTKHVCVSSIYIFFAAAHLGGK